MFYKRLISAALSMFIVFGSTIISFAVEKHSQFLNNDEFGIAVSDCVRNSENEFFNETYRIIGKETTDIDFSEYSADKVLISQDGRFLLQFDSLKKVESCLKSLSFNRNIVYAETDTNIYTCDSFETDSDYSLSWGASVIKTNELSDYLKSIEFDKSVTVAVVDSGAAEINYIKDKIVSGYDFVENDSDPSNDIHYQSHGTFLSSIVAENTNGLPIYIMPVRVVSSKSAIMSNVVNGIYYAADHGADVINLSIGEKAGSCKSVDEAIKYAVSKNIAVVVSAGNQADDTEFYCPAHNTEAITVSAINPDMSFAEDYSNYGNAVDFAAPGTNITGYDAKGNKTHLTGTSMSSAYIASCMAILKLLYPERSIATLQSVLADSSINNNWDCYYGFGVPDMMFFAGYLTEDIALTPDKVDLLVGESEKLIAYNKFNLDLINTAEWVSSDNDVVLVDENGLVTAIKSGEAKIICMNNDNKKFAECIITVKKIESISLNKAPDKLLYIYKKDDFDPTGIEIKVDYSDGSSDIIKDYSLLSFDGFQNNINGKHIIYVSYQGLNTQFEVSIIYKWWQWVIKILLFGFIWY